MRSTIESTSVNDSPILRTAESTIGPDLAKHVAAVVDLPGLGQLAARNPERADGRNPELVPLGGDACKLARMLQPRDEMAVDAVAFGQQKVNLDPQIAEERGEESP